MKAELAELELMLARAIPEPGLEILQNQNPLALLTEALPRNTTLVEYIKYRSHPFSAFDVHQKNYWGDWRYMALVLPSDQPETLRLVDLGEAMIIDKSIDLYLRGIASSAPTHVSNIENNRIVPETEIDQSDSASTDFHKIGIGLRQLLIDSLWQDINPFSNENNAPSSLIIATDGELSRLPFEAFPLESPEKCLTDHYNIRYIDTVSELLNVPAGENCELGEPLVLADPDFDWQSPKESYMTAQQSSQEPTNPEDPDVQPVKRIYEWYQSREVSENAPKFSRLPGTRIEAELIGEYLKVTPWLDEEALEGKLKQNPSPSILHIATHGFFYPNQSLEFDGQFSKSPKQKNFKNHFTKLENPWLRSGLALAGAHHALKMKDCRDPDTEDGLLTAADVAEMDLLDTALVVLSACQSGLGDIEVGQGVIGLRTAFQLAGAKSLVMSLWSVDDLATCILMHRFYSNLFHRRLSRGESLIEAKRYLRYLTLVEMEPVWLTAKMKDRFIEANPGYSSVFESLKNLALDTQPFSHPYYWSAFILIGNPEPLPNSCAA